MIYILISFERIWTFSIQIYNSFYKLHLLLRSSSGVYVLNFSLCASWRIQITFIWTWFFWLILYNVIIGSCDNTKFLSFFFRKLLGSSLNWSWLQTPFTLCKNLSSILHCPFSSAIQIKELIYFVLVFILLVFFANWLLILYWILLCL